MDYYLPKIIRYYRPFSMDFSLPFTNDILFYNKAPLKNNLLANFSNASFYMT